jgi:hypothetical protein
VYTLHSRISALDYMVDLEVECSDKDVNDVTFVRATVTIGGCDTVKEFIACGMFPLASSFGFRDVTIVAQQLCPKWRPRCLFFSWNPFQQRLWAISW